VDLDMLTEVAAVLTWLHEIGKPIDLAPLKSQTPEQVAGLQLATGRPPLWLRQAPLPPDPAPLGRWKRPCLVRFGAPGDRGSSWAVLRASGPTDSILLDPRNGLVTVPTVALEATLLGAYGLYMDPDDLASIRAGEEGERVARLRDRLRAAGALSDDAADQPPVFNRALSEAVAAFQQREALPATGVMDATTAWLLVTLR